MIKEFEKISKSMDQLLEMISQGEGIDKNIEIKIIKSLETNNKNIKEEIDFLFSLKISKLDDIKIKDLEKGLKKEIILIGENKSIEDCLVCRVYNIFFYKHIENELKKLKIIINKINETNKIIIDISQLKDFIDFIEKNKSNKVINDIMITVLKNDKDIYHGNNVLDDISSLKHHLKNHLKNNCQR